jgi:hypothetical protein
MANEELKLSASNFGFDPSWIADILQKYGADVLALAIEAARNGFSVAFVVEVLQKFGPALLQFILDVFSHHQASLRMRNITGSGDVVTGDVIEGIDTSFLDVIIQKYLPIIIQKYLPAIWTQFGPAILKFVQDNLQSIFDQFGPQIVQMILNLILGNLKSKQ